MAKRLTTSEFIGKSLEVHGKRYCYGKSVYSGSKIPLTITCLLHGDFEQKPNGHLSGQGCPKCDKSARMDTQAFIDKAKDIHAGKYSYSKCYYNNSRTKVVITCPIHGDFEQLPDGHLRGYGCRKCRNELVANGQRMRVDDFIARANVAHGNKYDYSKVIFNGDKTPVLITCPIHGEFMQRPSFHMRGSDCPSCSRESRFGFARSRYISHCRKANNGLSSLYLIELSNGNERFYKIGITMQPVMKRFSGKMPYKIKMLKVLTKPASEIWDLEKRIHRELKHNRYSPQCKFDGFSECFSEISESILHLME